MRRRLYRRAASLDVLVIVGGGRPPVAVVTDPAAHPIADHSFQREVPADRGRASGMAPIRFTECRVASAPGKLP